VTDFRPDRIGMGIGGMRQRVKEFGGELRLERLNPGTLVEVVIPTKSLPQPPQTPTAPSAVLASIAK
jgi:signal transduction histidine kinase